MNGRPVVIPDHTYLRGPGPRVVVRFSGPIGSTWAARLRRLGATVEFWCPPCGACVTMTGDAAEELATCDIVAGYVPYDERSCDRVLEAGTALGWLDVAPGHPEIGASRHTLAGRPTDLRDLLTQGYRSGARIHVLAWGSVAAGTYDNDSYDADLYLREHRDAVLASAGPTSDGRTGPDLSAPGTCVVGPRATQASGRGWGLADPLPSYIVDGGTSAAVAVAGGATALLRQAWRRELGGRPAGVSSRRWRSSGAAPVRSRDGIVGESTTFTSDDDRPADSAGRHPAVRAGRPPRRHRTGGGRRAGCARRPRPSAGERVRSSGAGDSRSAIPLVTRTH